MAYLLRCPCGVMIKDYEPTFIATVNAHLEAEHPGRTYTENEIMFGAQEIPDRIVDAP